MLLKSSFYTAALPLGLLHNTAAFGGWKKSSPTAQTFRNIEIFLKASKIAGVPACDPVLSHFSHVRLFVTLWTAVRQSLCPWESPGNSTGVWASVSFWVTFPSPGVIQCEWRINPEEWLLFLEESSAWWVYGVLIGFHYKCVVDWIIGHRTELRLEASHPSAEVGSFSWYPMAQGANLLIPRLVFPAGPAPILKLSIQFHHERSH